MLPFHGADSEMPRDPLTEKAGWLTGTPPGPSAFHPGLTVQNARCAHILIDGLTASPSALDILLKNSFEPFFEAIMHKCIP